MIPSSNIFLSLQHVANYSPLFLNAQLLTLSEPPLAYIFCSEFSISQRHTGNNTVSKFALFLILYSRSRSRILFISISDHSQHEPSVFRSHAYLIIFICPLFANCSITYFILLLDSFIPPLRNLCHFVRFSVIYSYLTLHLSLYSYAQGLDNCSVTITYQNPLFNVLVISNIWSVGSMFQWLLMYFFKLPNFAFHIFYTLLLTCLQ